MNLHKKLFCWEITECDADLSCPMRMNGTACWEWAEKNNGFQCHYGMCKDCIVYLYYNENTILTPAEIEEVMKRRTLMRHAI